MQKAKVGVAALVVAAVPFTVAPLALGQAGAITAGSSVGSVRGIANLPPGVMPASMDLAGLEGMPVGARAGVVLLVGDEVLTLDVERFEILEDPTAVVITSPLGETRGENLGVLLLRGEIVGEAGSRVVVGQSAAGLHGLIRRADGRFLSVSTGPLDGPGVLLATDLREADMPPPPVEFCATPFDADLVVPEGPAQWTNRDDPQCRVARIAVDSDWEFTSNLFGGNAIASAGYAITLTAAISEIYRDEVNLRLLVPYVRTWSGDVDPYSVSGGDLLAQVADHWRTQQGSVPRTLTHLLSGRSDLSYGGVAYLSAMCSANFGYGVSGHLGGTFPYPILDNNNGNWDIVVMAHELGHNFGAPHTHDYSPQIDGCGTGDCTLSAQGTIMSYCHTCAGGLSNIELTFGPRVRDTITSYISGSFVCQLPGTSVQAVPDVAGVVSGESVVIDVLLNDIAAACDPDLVEIASFADGIQGGEVELVPADGNFPRARLRYTPAPDASTGDDAFNYWIVGSATPAIVTVHIDQLREPDLIPASEPGVEVAYYQLTNPSALPNFDALTPYAQAQRSTINIPSTNGVFATSGRSDQVGAVFTGVLNVPTSGSYNLFTESDDGSALYIGDELVVNNDGLHGMTERSGQIGLQAGTHRIRVEFFENGGGAGLIVRWQGPGISKVVIPTLAWAHEVEPCLADWDLSGGAPDSSDFLAFLNSYSAHEPRADLAPAGGNGVFDSSDFLAYLNAFSQGC
ncbi:MAG: PA14 domain-containing protein [Phycisphaerales bacterium]|jgi:hypothetical protein|nr:PA14 domain-containing protein [Phycisphaerales bacterium]